MPTNRQFHLHRETLDRVINLESQVDQPYLSLTPMQRFVRILYQVD
jgi:hypothetical protein